MNAYKPSHIANFFLKKANDQGIDVTILKLLKLVYIGYGWVLALTGRKLFDEDIQAWQHGPVVPSIYYEFKHFGKAPINKFATDFNLETNDLSVPEINENDEDVLFILNRVWDIYHKFSAWALRDKTHEPDTPWTKTYNESTPNKIIEPGIIKEHFETKIKQYLDAAEQ